MFLMDVKATCHRTLCDKNTAVENATNTGMQAIIIIMIISSISSDGSIAQLLL